MNDKKSDEKDGETNTERIRDSKHTESNVEGNIPFLPNNYKRLPDLPEETDPDDSAVVGQRIYSLQNDTGETFDVFDTVDAGFIGRYRNTDHNYQWVQILEKYSPMSSLQCWKDAGYETTYTNGEKVQQIFSNIPQYPINSKYDPTTRQYVVNEFDVTPLPYKVKPDLLYWESIIDSERINGDRVVVYKNYSNELLVHVKQKSPQLASMWYTLDGLNLHREDDRDEFEATLNHFMDTVEVDR